MVAHDGTIIKYNVDLKENNIEMTVELYDGMQNICFYNTLTHYFAHILSGNVIGDIYEIEAKYFIEDNKDILWEGKNFCWPLDYDDMYGLEENIKENKYKIYIIEGAYGFDGWIIAKEMKIIDLNG